MNPETTKEAFSEMVKPFSFYHEIYFKVGSAAYESVGISVFGRFIKPTKNKQKQLLKEPRFFIDAPRINRKNGGLSSENKSALYYHGIEFEEIDIVQSYPKEILKEEA